MSTVLSMIFQSIGSVFASIFSQEFRRHNKTGQAEADNTVASSTKPKLSHKKSGTSPTPSTPQKSANNNSPKKVGSRTGT